MGGGVRFRGRKGNSSSTFWATVCFNFKRKKKHFFPHRPVSLSNARIIKSSKL